jgi:hypothetical protein
MHLYHPFLVVLKKDGNAIFTTHDVIHEPLNTTWHVLLQLDSQL